MSLRRAIAPALWGLRAYWGTAALLLAMSATALAAVLPIAALVAPSEAGLSTRLELAPWRGGDLGIGWSALAWSPTATRHAALVIFFRLLLGMAAGLLAVAGLTVLSVSATRASGRASEMTLRRAIGASRRHLWSAALFESGAITAGALLVGGVLATVAGRIAIAAWPGTVGQAAPVATAVTVVAALAGIVLGAMLPLAIGWRRSALPRATGAPVPLVVPALQLGLSLTVLTAAALLEREAARLMVPGRPTSETGQVFEVSAPESPPARRAAQYAALVHRLRTRPHVEAVGLTSPGTLVGLGMVDVLTTDCGNCPQGGVFIPLHPVPTTHYLVSADTFRILGLAVTAGRGLTDADEWGAPRVAVVNQPLAARHFQRGQAVGRGILIGRRPAEWYTVVGVVDDQRPTGFGGGLEPPYAVYLSVLQHPARAVDLIVRAPRDAGLIPAVDRGLRSTVGGSATQSVRVTASRLRATQAAPLHWFGDMYGALGWVILIVATLGTSVVMRAWVTSRLYELGVRRAVGARRRDILRFILWRAAAVAIGGVAIGVWVGLVVWGTLATVVAGLPPWDVEAALRIAPTLLGATLAGAGLPAWRAARVAPLTLVEARAR